MISQHIIRNPYISAVAKTIYIHFASYAGLTNTVHIGRDQICYELRINKDTLSRYMWELKCWQIIQIEQSRGEKSQYGINQYTINHYPKYIMMEQSKFEEEVLPLLQELTKSKTGKPQNPNNKKKVGLILWQKSNSNL